MTRALHASPSLLTALTLTAVALTGVGCMSDKLRMRAANEFRCPTGKVQLEDLETGAVRATGCGQTAQYVCNSKVCVKQTEEGAAASERPEPKAAPREAPGTKTIKRGQARFSLPKGFQRDTETEGEVYRDEEHHAVLFTVAPHDGDEDAWLDKAYAEAKRWSENVAGGELNMATKMEGGTQRWTSAVLVRGGKAYELTCTTDDAASTKTDATCMKILRSLRVVAEDK